MTRPPAPEEARTSVLPPPGGPEPEPSRRLGWGIALGALVLVAVAAAAAAAYFATRGGTGSAAGTTAPAAPPATATQPAVAAPSRVVVPAVTGLQQAAAAARLGAAHLTPRVQLRATPKPDGTVVAQSPAGGRRVKPSSTVTLVVDRGAPAAVVPRVTALKAAAAEAKLAGAGLKAKTTPVSSARQPAGTVVAQAPAAGSKLARGSVITLSVASRPAGTATAPTASTTSATTTTATTTTSAPSHPATASVPDLSGQTLADATAALGRAGLYPNVVYIPGSDPLGTVLEQAKPAGTSVPWGSYVRVNVSSGPSPQAATVPDVTQQPRAQAMQSLSAGGFQTKVLWRQVASNVRNDVVLDEQPAHGNSAPKGALVVLIVSKQR